MYILVDLLVDLSLTGGGGGGGGSSEPREPPLATALIVQAGYTPRAWLLNH